MVVLGQCDGPLVEVADEGSLVGTRPRINFIGAGVTAVDVAASDRVDVTIPGGGVTDHGALGGLGDDDHPQYGALTQAEAVAALWTFGAGLALAAGQTIEDSGGTPRIALAIASPHLTLTGDVDINSGFLALGSLASIDANVVANVVHEFAATGVFQSVNGLFANIHDVAASGGPSSLRGFGGEVRNVKTGGSMLSLTGLFFSALQDSSQSVASLVGVNATAKTISGSTGAVTDAYAAQLTVNALGVVPINAYGAHINVVAGTNRYGLRIVDISAGTIARLLELGDTSFGQVYLRLLGSGEWTPTANKTPLYVAEGTFPLLRQVQWKAGNALVAGDRVMVLV